MHVSTKDIPAFIFFRPFGEEKKIREVLAAARIFSLQSLYEAISKSQNGKWFSKNLKSSIVSILDGWNLDKENIKKGELFFSELIAQKILKLNKYPIYLLEHNKNNQNFELFNPLIFHLEKYFGYNDIYFKNLGYHFLRNKVSQKYRINDPIKLLATMTMEDVIKIFLLYDQQERQYGPKINSNQTKILISSYESVLIDLNMIDRIS